MSHASLMYFQDQFQTGIPRRDYFTFSITGAKASSLVLQQSAISGFYDTITQATIDAFFGSTNEILAIKYDSTAMGTDAFGVLLNYGGQVQTLVKARAYSATGTGNATEVPRTTLNGGLTDSSLSTQGVLTTLGNIGLRFVITGLDALTSGLIVVEVDWISK